MVAKKQDTDAKAKAKNEQQSKIGTVIDLLRRDEGATLDELTSATG